MRIIGHIYFEDEVYAAHTPELRAHATADGLDELVDEIKNSIASAIDGKGESVEPEDIEVQVQSASVFTVSTCKTKALITALLQHLQASKKVSSSELARRINAKYPNAVRQYLSGKSAPGIEKLNQLVNAMGFDIEVHLVSR